MASDFIQAQKPITTDQRHGPQVLLLDLAASIK